jgi:putative polyketide hydroxylase
MSDEPEVLIIGAGPVGLSSALALGRAGIRTLVLERRSELSRYPKANGVHPRTMEIFQELGVAEPVRNLTAGMAQGAIFVWKTRLNGIEIGELAVGGDSDTVAALPESPSPERLNNAGQHMFEPFLARAAEELDGVTVRLGTEVIGLTVEDESVIAEYTDTGGTRRTVKPQYVIGADGVRSFVRATLGVGEHGQESLGTAINVQFDADLDGYFSGRLLPVVWVANKDTQGAFIRDSATRWRYNFDIPPEADPGALTQEQCKQEVIRAVGEEIPIKIHYTWSWAHDQAVTDTWRQGRVFLAGDSAHHFPPHGGFGLNSGVQDAHNLAWKLVARLRWHAGDRLLDSYQAERLPVAEFNGEQCMRNTHDLAKTGFLSDNKAFLTAIEADTDEGDRARKVFAEGINAQRDHLASDGQQFGLQYESDAVVPDGSEIVKSTVADYRPTARPGARAPHSWVMSQGAKISTLHVYDGGFTLFTGPDNTAWATAADQVNRELGIPVQHFALGRHLLPVNESVDNLLDRYGLQRTGAVLIRPDGIVGFRSAAATADEHTQLRGALGKILDLDGASWRASNQPLVCH